MMKTLPLLLIGVVIFLFGVKSPSFAQAVTPTDTPTATSSATTGVDSKSNANLVINSVEQFLKNLDSLSGGLVFTTPSIFSNSVKLPDGTQINGLNAFRNVFWLVSVPVTGIIIFWFGGIGMASNQMQFIKQFAIRIAKYVFMLLFLVPLLSFSINTENLLTSSILSIPQVKEQSFTAFTNDYYTSAGQKIASGQATGESLAVPNPNFFDMMSSIAHVITELFFFLITLLALVFGLLFIIMQFILRFISMLFLSLLFPLVIPFVLSEKTEGIINNYLKVWFTFLIHQPAFALGYVMVMVIVRSMLVRGGANISLLLLYTGSLFFLGTVNILASRIFADVWTATATNFAAGAFAAVGNRIMGKGADLMWENKDKLISAMKNIKIGGFDEVLHKRPPNLATVPAVYTAEYGGQMLQEGARTGRPFYGTNPSDTTNTPPTGVTQTPVEEATVISSTAPQMKKSFSGTYTRELRRNGFSTEVVDKKQGIVSAEGTGYTYYDKKNDLSYTYLSKKDALATGLSQNEITETALPKRNYVDLSQFRKGENQFNTEATKKAMSMGFDSEYAHVTRRSDAVRIKRHLEMNKERFSELGVNGIISRHYDNHKGMATKETTRIISLGKGEK